VGLITTVASAKKGTKSLKTAIPEGIVEFIELSSKDEIESKMHIQNDERVALVRKGIGLDETTGRLISKHVRPNKVKRHG
jgi:hypothetical protein